MCGQPHQHSKQPQVQGVHILSGSKVLLTQPVAPCRCLSCTHTQHHVLRITQCICQHTTIVLSAFSSQFRMLSACNTCHHEVTLTTHTLAVRSQRGKAPSRNTCTRLHPLAKPLMGCCCLHNTATNVRTLAQPAKLQSACQPAK